MPPKPGLGMKSKVKPFAVSPGRKVRLDEWPTRIRPGYRSEEDYKRRLQAQVEELSEKQRILYASNRYPCC